MTTDEANVRGWYISRDGEMDGPLSSEEMRYAISHGRVKPDHRVWRDGMESWVEAREIPNYGELRRAQLAADVNQGREKSRDRVRASDPNYQDSWAPRQTTQQPSSAKRSTTSGRPPRVEKPASLPYEAPSGQTGWEKSSGNFDLEKMAKEYLPDFGKVPMGAIAFVVLGFMFLPLAPVFWFIAWRIWSKTKS